MRIYVRFIIFTIALLLGLGVWYTLARAQTPSRTTTNTNINGNINAHHDANANAGAHTWTQMNGNMSATMNRSSAQNGAYASVDEDQVEDAPATVTLSLPKSLWGYATLQKLRLRSAPAGNATVVETIELMDYEGAEILATTRDYLHVKFSANAQAEGGTRERDSKGWVEWGEVQSPINAIVLDAGTGEVVARIPLDSGLASAAFSEDGKRVIFYAGYGQGAHGEGSTSAVEFDAETFKPLRTIETTAANGFAAFSFDGEDIHAITQQTTYTEHSETSALRHFRIDGEKVEEIGANQTATRIKGRFVVSPDARTALIFHRNEHNSTAGRVDVIDLKTLGLRNSFEIPHGGNDTGWPGEHALSRDASELYFMGTNGDTISVFNTTTGRRVRKMRLRVSENVGWGLWPDGILSDAVLLKRWMTKDDSEESVSESFWLNAAGEQRAAGSGIDNVIEAGGTLYAVNDEATIFFKLDGEKHVSEKIRIERRELDKDKPEGNGQRVFNLAASPDGKRIIIFIGEMDGC